MTDEYKVEAGPQAPPRPGLPIEYPTAYDLVVNLATARQLGIEIPNKLMRQATEFIE
jgi:ABC-type uncharacterized transport system substrate-binding protein